MKKNMKNFFSLSKRLLSPIIPSILMGEKIVINLAPSRGGDTLFKIMYHMVVTMEGIEICMIDEISYKHRYLSKKEGLIIKDPHQGLSQQDLVNVLRHMRRVTGVGPIRDLIKDIESIDSRLRVLCWGAEKHFNA